MSNKSKAKAVADVLESDVSKWWSWESIIEKVIPGFSMVPRRGQAEILGNYISYLPHVYAEMDARKRFVLRDGRSNAARFKIATKDDIVEVQKRLVSLKKRGEGIENRIHDRVNNLKGEKILPKSWNPETPALTA